MRSNNNQAPQQQQMDNLQCLKSTALCPGNLSNQGIQVTSRHSRLAAELAVVESSLAVSHFSGSASSKET